VLPFFFLFNPGVLLVGGVGDILSDTLLGTMLVLIASVALHGWVIKAPVPVWLRLVLVGLAVGIIHPAGWVEYPSGLAALVVYLMLYRQGRATLRRGPIAAAGASE
jgi:TRAP-type uncharacterized transport system fused permease subunit